MIFECLSIKDIKASFVSKHLIIYLLNKRTEVRLFLEVGREKVISHQVGPSTLLYFSIVLYCSKLLYLCIAL